MKQVSVIGVLVGAVTDIVSTNLFTLPVAVYATLTNGIVNLSKDRQQVAVLAAFQANAALYASPALGVVEVTDGVSAAALGQGRLIPA